MSDKTAHEILKMPSDAEFILRRNVPNLGNTLQGFGNIGFVADLQKLAKFWLMRKEMVLAIGDGAAIMNALGKDVTDIIALLDKIDKIEELDG